MNEPIIGIDLGTTYSCVGVYYNNAVHIVPNEFDERITPSYVAFTDTEIIVGTAAKSQCEMNPLNTIFDSKRMIGRRFTDETLQSDLSLWPFHVVPDEQQLPMIMLTSRGEVRSFSPEEISAFIIRKMKTTAEKHCGQAITKAVITVPAYFNDAQRAGTKAAGELAGLKVLRIINEPTAAALAYGLQRQLVEDDSKEQYTERLTKEGKNILIYDLGGGTFDVSLLTVSHGMFEVKATEGDSHLGGEDFDENVMEFLLEKFFSKNEEFLTAEAIKSGITKEEAIQILYKNEILIRRLRSACESAKKQLSFDVVHRITLDNFFSQLQFDEEITRFQFEVLNKKLFQSTLLPVENVLREAKLDKSNVSEIVFIGGSTRIPYIQKLLDDFFPTQIKSRSINVDEAVAYGATIQAAVLTRQWKSEFAPPSSEISQSVTPSTGDNSIQSIKKTLQNSSSSKTGASSSKVLLIDVTPLSLGVKTVGGKMNVLIKRNAVIPCQNSQIFTTHEDNQTHVTIEIFEGERVLTSMNSLLGSFEIGPLPLLPKGVPVIEVSFTLDANGILHVNALEKNSGNSNHLIINSNTNRCTDTERKEMMKEFAEWRDEDAQLKSALMAKDGFEALLTYWNNLYRKYEEEKVNDAAGKVQEEQKETEEDSENNDKENVDLNLMKSKLKGEIVAFEKKREKRLNLKIEEEARMQEEMLAFAKWFEESTRNNLSCVTEAMFEQKQAEMEKEMFPLLRRMQVVREKRK